MINFPTIDFPSKVIIQFFNNIKKLKFIKKNINDIKIKPQTPFGISAWARQRIIKKGIVNLPNKRKEVNNITNNPISIAIIPKSINSILILPRIIRHFIFNKNTKD